MPSVLQTSYPDGEMWQEIKSQGKVNGRLDNHLKGTSQHSQEVLRGRLIYPVFTAP